MEQALLLVPEQSSPASILSSDEPGPSDLTRTRVSLERSGIPLVADDDQDPRRVRGDFRGTSPISSDVQGIRDDSPPQERIDHLSNV
jgi:hypothetical protein